MRKVLILCLISLAGCSVKVAEHEGPDYNGDGRVGFRDLEAPRSEAAYVPSDTRTAEQRLDDHMDRQKGGDAYERDRR